MSGFGSDATLANLGRSMAAGDGTRPLEIASGVSTQARGIAADFEAALGRRDGTVFTAQELGQAHLVYRPDEPGVHGQPDIDRGLWHLQGDNHCGEAGTCAVVAQEMVIFSFEGLDPGEGRCLQIALDKGWFEPGGGTPLEDVGKLLPEFGIGTETRMGCGMEDLARAIDEGRGIIVGVDAHELWLDDLPTGRANHAVMVTGYERGTDGGIEAIFVNDSGTPDGAGARHDAATFERAFSDTGGFMVKTTETAPRYAQATA